MSSAEKRRGRDGQTYYRARYIRPDGNKSTVHGSEGKAVRYPTRNTALKAAREAEREADAAAGRGRWVAPEKGRVTLGEYVLGEDGDEGWLARQDVAASSSQSYGHYLKRIPSAQRHWPISSREPSTPGSAVSAPKGR